jgi:hypothetical protein
MRDRTVLVISHRTEPVAGADIVLTLRAGRVVEDERPDAPPVLVIAYDEWQRRFDGDSGVIGTQVRLDGEMHTVVGVMPEGFLFPVRHHFWTALRLPSRAAATTTTSSRASPTE